MIKSQRQHPGSHYTIIVNNAVFGSSGAHINNQRPGLHFIFRKRSKNIGGRTENHFGFHIQPRIGGHAQKVVQTIGIAVDDMGIGFEGTGTLVYRLFEATDIINHIISIKTVDPHPLCRKLPGLGVANRIEYIILRNPAVIALHKNCTFTENGIHITSGHHQ